MPGISQSEAKNRENTSEAVHLHLGAKAPFSGYLLSETYARDVAQGWQKAVRDSDSWKNAYSELSGEVKESVSESKLALARTQEAFEAERKAMRRASARATRNSMLIAIIIGGVLGAVLHNNL